MNLTTTTGLGATGNLRNIVIKINISRITVIVSIPHIPGI